MNAKQRNQKDNVGENLLRVKQLIILEREKKEEQSQKILSLLKSFKKANFLESCSTIMREQDKHIGPKVDFSYYKINLSFLKNSGIDLEQISSDILVSDSCANMMYVEYYIDRKNCCIIFVKYHFDHVHLYTEDGKTDCLTYTFVNTKSEFYYYDETIGCKLFKRFTLKTNLSDARDLIRNKTYELKASNKNLFKLSCSTNSEIFEEKCLSDIHLLIKALTDILVNEYKDSCIPSKSKIHIETKFVGISDEPVDIQVKARVNYNYYGVIQITEKLSEYEITLYFLDLPEKKVTARFYLSNSEKEGSLVLTDNLLENIVLEPVNEKINNKFYYKNLYKRYLINKMETTKRGSELDPLAKAIYENSIIAENSIDCPKLKDSFGKIYIETFKIDAKKVCKKFPFKQIQEYKFEYNGNSFQQCAMYYAVYNGKIYLIEAYTSYVAYFYTDSCTTIYIPAFGTRELTLNIFNPINADDVDKFVNRVSANKCSRTPLQYSSNHFRDVPISRRLGPIHSRGLWRTVFSDFVVKTNAVRENYQVESIDSGTIYSKILNCIKESRTIDSSFNFSTNYPFGFDDEECPRTRIPLIANELTYGYYFDDGFNKISVNSPLTDKCDYSYSTGDDLMKVVFDNEVPYFRTTMHNLFERYESILYRSSEIKDTYLGYHITEIDFWKECIDFLFSTQCENLFK